MSPSFVIFRKSKVISNVAQTLSMDIQRRVSIIPNGQPIQTGALLIIEENESLDSFIARASEELWDGERNGKNLFFSTGMRIRRNLNAILNGDTLYISEGEDWIGISLFFHLN